MWFCASVHIEPHTIRTHVGWSGQEKKMQALRSEEKLRGRPFQAQSTLWERVDTSQARRHITGLPSSYNKSRRSCNLFVDTIKYARISTSRQALCWLLWSRGAHEADQTRGERALSNLDTDVSASEASRKLLEQQLTELKTQQRAEQPLSKGLESARGALQRAQGREEEARGAFTLAQSVKEQADQEAAKIQSEPCTLKPTMQPQKPQAHALDRCSDIMDSTISAWHQAGVPTEPDKPRSHSSTACMVCVQQLGQ